MSTVKVIDVEDTAWSEQGWAFMAPVLPSSIEVMIEGAKMVPPQELAKINPKVVLGTSQRVSLIASESLGAATLALAVPLLLAQLITYVDQYVTPRKRRRRRSANCVQKCIGIVAAAELDLGFMENRALQTENVGQKRTVRKFLSRA